MSFDYSVLLLGWEFCIHFARHGSNFQFLSISRTVDISVYKLPHHIEYYCIMVNWMYFLIDLTDYSLFTQWPRFHVGYLLAFRAQ